MKCTKIYPRKYILYHTTVYIQVSHIYSCVYICVQVINSRISVNKHLITNEPALSHLYLIITARQCTVCSLVYCTHTNRYSSALDTWAVFHTSRMRRLYTSQNEHFAYTYDIAVCIWIQYIRHHLSAYFR